MELITVILASAGIIGICAGACVAIYRSISRSLNAAQVLNSTLITHLRNDNINLRLVNEKMWTEMLKVLDVGQNKTSIDLEYMQVKHRERMAEINSPLPVGLAPETGDALQEPEDVAVQAFGGNGVSTSVMSGD